MKNKDETERGFIEDFFAAGKRIIRGVDPTTKNTIRHDKWDREDLRAVFNEIQDMAQAQQDLSGITETAPGAIEDTFFGLMKAEPELKSPADVRPSYMVNLAVMGAAVELTEFEKLRLTTTGDMVAAGLAVAEMEPELEKLFDQLQTAQDMADNLQGMMDAYGDMQGEADDLDKMIAEAMAGGGGELLEDFQAQQDRIKEAMDKLEGQIKEKQIELENSLRDSAPQIQEHVKKAMDQAQEQADSMDNMSSAWGLEAGAIQRLPAQKRIELAKRMNNDKFRRLAQMIGPMQRLALSEQSRRTIYAREEIHDITLGDDITRALPTEIMLLGDDATEIDFFTRLIEKRLMQYELRGTEKVAKGDIFFCEDGSGSMGGDREVWAKAVGLALMQIAHKQNRGFTGVHFGSPGEYLTFEFDQSGGAWTEGSGGGYGSKATYPREYYEQIEAVMFFAELFFGGGTDFMTPLSACLEKLQRQHAEFGAVKGDIVFVTDGQCGVDTEWLKEFKKEQHRLGFRVWGIIIDGYPESEPLNEICDGHVWGIGDLLDGTGVSEIFREI